MSDGSRYGRSGVYAAYRFLRDTTPQYADWPLRLAFAAVFLFHAFDKLDTGIEEFATMMDMSVGVTWLVVLTEFSAGVLILVGGLNLPFAALATRVAGALAIPVMVGAIEKLHWDRWHFTPAEGFPMGGMMFQTLLIGIGLYFVVTAGRLDIERRAQSEASA